MKKSIETFGFKVPLVIDKNNVIVAGHTRYKAAQSLGLEKVPCIVADDLSDEQLKAFRLADNKTAELATWDFDKLADELLEISELDKEIFNVDMSDFGFNNNETAGVDVNMDELFGKHEPTHHDKKENKTVTCPHCGESFEV